MSLKGLMTTVVSVTQQGTQWFRVVLGPFADKLDAERAKSALEAAEKQLKAADSDKARATAEAALAAAIAQLKTLDHLRNRRH